MTKIMFLGGGWEASGVSCESGLRGKPHRCICTYWDLHLCAFTHRGKYP